MNDPRHRKLWARAVPQVFCRTMCTAERLTEQAAEAAECQAVKGKTCTAASVMCNSSASVRLASAEKPLFGFKSFEEGHQGFATIPDVGRGSSTFRVRLLSNLEGLAEFDTQELRSDIEAARRKPTSPARVPIRRQELVLGYSYFWKTAGGLPSNAKKRIQSFFLENS